MDSEISIYPYKHEESSTEMTKTDLSFNLRAKQNIFPVV